MSIQISLLDPLLMEVVSVESLTIIFYNIDNIEIARTNDLEIVAAIDEALSSL